MSLCTNLSNVGQLGRLDSPPSSPFFLFILSRFIHSLRVECVRIVRHIWNGFGIHYFLSLSLSLFLIHSLVSFP